MLKKLSEIIALFSAIVGIYSTLTIYIWASKILDSGELSQISLLIKAVGFSDVISANSPSVLLILVRIYFYALPILPIYFLLYATLKIRKTLRDGLKWKLPLLITSFIVLSLLFTWITRKINSDIINDLLKYNFTPSLLSRNEFLFYCIAFLITIETHLILKFICTKINFKKFSRISEYVERIRNSEIEEITDEKISYYAKISRLLAIIYVILFLPSAGVARPEYIPLSGVENAQIKVSALEEKYLDEVAHDNIIWKDIYFIPLQSYPDKLDIILIYFDRSDSAEDYAFPQITSVSKSDLAYRSPFIGDEIPRN